MTMRNMLTRMSIMVKKEAVKRIGKCALCGNSPVELHSYRSSDFDVDGEVRTRQVALCDGCGAPFKRLLNESGEHYRTPRGACEHCGVKTDDLRRCEVEAIDKGRRGTARRLWLCPTCRAPLMMVLNMVAPQRTYEPMRVVSSISELMPSRALWAQAHGGKKPPKRLGLK